MNIKVINQKNISRVIINEPKTYNSLSFKNLNDLIKVFKKLDDDKKIKVIILEGAGKGFSAGHNLKEVRSLKGKSNYNKLYVGENCNGNDVRDIISRDVQRIAFADCNLLLNANSLLSIPWLIARVGNFRRY